MSYGEVESGKNDVGVQLRLKTAPEGVLPLSHTSRLYEKKNARGNAGMK